MIRTTYFLLLVILAAAKADKMREFDVKMVDCDACGMNLDAKLAIKVCGNGPVPCCGAVNLNSLADDFQAGATDHFQGNRQIGECAGFDLGAVSTDSDIYIGLYHSGGDGGSFEWAQVDTTTAEIYRCYFGLRLSDDQYFSSRNCTRVQ